MVQQRRRGWWTHLDRFDQDVNVGSGLDERHEIKLALSITSRHPLLQDPSATGPPSLCGQMDEAGTHSHPGLVCIVHSRRPHVLAFHERGESFVRFCGLDGGNDAITSSHRAGYKRYQLRPLFYPVLWMNCKRQCVRKCTHGRKTLGRGSLSSPPISLGPTSWR